MKSKLRYLSGILMLISLSVIFFPMIKIAGTGISLWNVITAISAKDVDSGIFSEVMNRIGTYAKPYFGGIVFWILFTLLIVILTCILKSKTAYIVAIVGQIVQICLVLMMYVKLKEKLSMIKKIIDFFGIGNSVAFQIMPFVFWTVLQIICFIINIRGLTVKEKIDWDLIDEMSPDQKDFGPLKWNEQNHYVPQSKPINIGGGDSNKINTRAFYGALVGVDKEYAGLVLQMNEKQKVYVWQEEGHILIQKRIEKSRENEFLADIYYLPEYEEYCITPAKYRTIYLESGQPLGKDRLYYLPRAMKIKVQDSGIENWFELA